MSGKATLDDMPGADGSDGERAALEAKHTGKIYSALRSILKKVTPPDTTTSNISPDEAVRRYREAAPTLRDALVSMLTDGVLLGAKIGGEQVEYLLGVRKSATIIGVDWDLINQDALDWVISNPSQLGRGFGDGYANTVLSAMNTTSENQLHTMISEWIRNGLTYNNLLSQLERTVFSRRRAEMVAVTEITRAYAVGNQVSWRRSGVIHRKRFQTSNDEKVCQICSPRNQMVTNLDGDWDGVSLPAHIRCRCWCSPVITFDEDQQTP